MNPIEAYLSEIRYIRSTGAGTAETSHYTPLANLLNEIGKTVKPRVRCVMQLANRGAGLPDGGLFTPDQIQRAREDDPLLGQTPSRGVIEVKPLSDDAWVTADGTQVSRYWGRYGQVLVTNLRDFVLVGKDAEGRPAKLETYRLAASQSAFLTALSQPGRMAEDHSERFTEYLKRVLLHEAPLATPEDVAWFLASYARDARARLEAGELPGLRVVREALEDALGLKFEGDKGEHFFRSTLVQTLFYGIFSAWVLWSRDHPPSSRAVFNWHEAIWYLRVPMIKSLFEQVATPGTLGPLGLVEVLDWTGAALNRVDRASFFDKFEEGHAVQYFYEPFLKAFDPELRKQLGVWYTPREVVQYMVARVDTVLREELKVQDGLADPNVYVLDPCCGTGAYLVEVLKRIHKTLQGKRGDALVANDVKQAATSRVFGFEILPAPFVVAHLQLGLVLQSLGAPLSESKNERPGVYLTNALTGWEPTEGPQRHLAFPELEEERDAAEHVKRDTPILVVLGNPPYNGFAGVAMAEERALTTAYRKAKATRQPKGQGLNDLYVRFFRMAERRIVEKTGEGVVCFISNYSWLDGLSFTAMRERYLDVFDGIWIDCLNGDKYKTGKLTPEGEPDPSIFSTEWNREGIQVGTAVSLLVRRAGHETSEGVRFRHLWGKDKRAELLSIAENDGVPAYEVVAPPNGLGLPYMPMRAVSDYMNWPKLPDLFPVSYPGVKTSRDDLLVDIDRDRLIARMERYFDPNVSHEEMGHIAPSATETTARFDARKVRGSLLKRGFLRERVVRYCYRPFDVRWLYWEPETKLLDEKREGYFPQVFEDNLWISAGQRNRMEAFYQPQFVTQLADHHLVESNVGMFPLKLRDAGGQRTLFAQHSDLPRANITQAAQQFLSAVGVEPDQLFHHSLAVLHSPAYSIQNAGALRQDWPRIPLPASGDVLSISARLGHEVATLMDSESPVEGVTAGPLRAELGGIAIASKSGGGSLDPGSGDLSVTPGWGHRGQGGAVMPGKGRVAVRDYTVEEMTSIQQGARALGMDAPAMVQLLGEKTYDVYMNGRAFWQNIPERVWGYTLGGYPVLKKWLSYRESDILGRALRPDEVREVTNVARRIAAILLLQPQLDANYETVTDGAYPWPGTVSEQ